MITSRQRRKNLPKLKTKSMGRPPLPEKIKVDRILERERDKREKFTQIRVSKKTRERIKKLQKRHKFASMDSLINVALTEAGYA